MKKTILLVDDDSDDCEIFMESMRDIDPRVQCLCASNGSQALSEIKEKGNPDLIFLDINMPIMDGWQCLASIKEDEGTKHIPVIMYSTSSNHRDVDRAFKLGASCFFIKPYDFKELKSTLGVIVSNLEGEPLKRLRSIKHMNLTCPDLDLSHPTP